MATGRSFAVFASHSVRQPITPKTRVTVTTNERKDTAEKADDGNERNGEGRANNSAPVRTSVGSGA